MTLVLGSLSTNQTVAAALVAVVGEQVIPALVEKVCEWGAAAFSRLEQSFTLPQVAGQAVVPLIQIDQLKAELQQIGNATIDIMKKLDDQKKITDAIIQEKTQEEVKQKNKARDHESAMFQHRRLSDEMFRENAFIGEKLKEVNETHPMFETVKQPVIKHNAWMKEKLLLLDTYIKLAEESSTTKEDVATFEEITRQLTASVMEEERLQGVANELIEKHKNLRLNLEAHENKSKDEL